MPYQIKMMADYSSFPLWWVNDERVGDIDPSTLPISTSIQERFVTWTQRYDETLNHNDPLQSGFASEEEELSFEREGIWLWKALREELNPKYEVSYFSDRLQKLFYAPDSLPTR